MFTRMAPHPTIVRSPFSKTFPGSSRTVTAGEKALTAGQSWARYHQTEVTLFVRLLGSGDSIRRIASDIRSSIA